MTEWTPGVNKYDNNSERLTFSVCDEIIIALHLKQQTESLLQSLKLMRNCTLGTFYEQYRELGLSKSKIS